MPEDLFTTRAPAVSYLERGVPPPAPLYIGPNETLVADTWSSTAPAALAIVARVLTPGGRVHTSRWSHTPNTGRTRATTYHNLPEGFLLSVAVDATGAAYRRGHCWCQVGIQIGADATGVPHGQLISDYVTGTARLAWPGGQLRSSVEGPGLIHSITGTDPAAGAEVNETVPTGARWLLLSLRAILATSAVVGNRYITWMIDDGLSVVWTEDFNAPQTAGTTLSHILSGDDQRHGNYYTGTHTPLYRGPQLVAGWRIHSYTPGLDPGDDWGAPVLHVEEWIEP